MTVESNQIQVDSVDFVTMEKVRFYHGNAIELDRVYLNDNNHLVAFFSNEKCQKLKEIIHQGAWDFYSNNRKLLFTEEPNFTPIIQSENLDGEIQASTGRQIGKNAATLFGAHYAVTRILKWSNQRSNNVFVNMYNRAEACRIVNSIVNTKGNNYFSTEIKQFFNGIEVDFGNKGEFVKPRFFSSQIPASRPEISTIQDVFTHLNSIELLFREGIASNSDGIKNAASAQLTAVNDQFIQLFENIHKYSYILSDTPSPIQRYVIFARKYLNYLTVGYKWISTTLNLFGLGEIRCKQVTNTGIECYYLTRGDAQFLKDNLSLKLTTTICRYTNTFDLEAATNATLNNTLSKNKTKLEELADQRDKLEQDMADMDQQILTEIQNLATAFPKAFLPGGVTNCISAPKCDPNSLIDMISKQAEDQRELKKLKKKLAKEIDLREMIFLHLQLKYLEKTGMKYSSIILSIIYHPKQEREYEIRILF